MNIQNKSIKYTSSDSHIPLVLNKDQNESPSILTNQLQKIKENNLYSVQQSEIVTYDSSLYELDCVDLDESDYISTNLRKKAIPNILPSDLRTGFINEME